MFLWYISRARMQSAKPQSSICSCTEPLSFILSSLCIPLLWVICLQNHFHASLLLLSSLNHKNVPTWNESPPKQVKVKLHRRQTQIRTQEQTGACRIVLWGVVLCLMNSISHGYICLFILCDMYVNEHWGTELWTLMMHLSNSRYQCCSQGHSNWDRDTRVDPNQDETKTVRVWDWDRARPSRDQSLEWLETFRGGKPDTRIRQGQEERQKKQLKCHELGNKLSGKQESKEEVRE